MSFIDSFSEEVKDNFIEFEELFENVTIVGIGALICNGLSYRPIEANFSILTSSPELNGYFSGIYKYIYLPNYNKSIGFDNIGSIPSAERAICDYILYSELLPEFEFLEALDFYMQDEDYGDISKIKDLGLNLGIAKDKLNQYLRM